MTNVCRELLQTMLDVPNMHTADKDRMDVDENDGFGPVRTNHTTTKTIATSRQAILSPMNSVSADFYVSLLATLPFLQAGSGEAMRDKELTEIVLNCDSERFVLVAEPYFENVSQRILSIGMTTFDAALTKLGSLLSSYDTGRDGRLHLLVIHFLNSTMHLWLQGFVATSETSLRVQELCDWLCTNLNQKALPLWRIRDKAIRFMDRYLQSDPSEAVWCGSRPKAREQRPTKILPFLMQDDDIHIRFRAAISNSHVFPLFRRSGRDPLLFYDEVRPFLCKLVDMYVLFHSRMNHDTDL